MNAFRKFICWLATASTLLVVSSVAVSAQSEECSFLSTPQGFNTSEREDGTVVIGQVSDRPYIVLLTHDLQESLSTIRVCVPDAFLTSSRLGSYVHIASFKNYGDAKVLSEQLENALNLDVRIVHRARLRQY